MVSDGGSTPAWFRPHADANAHARTSEAYADVGARCMAVRFRPGGGSSGCLETLLLQRRLRRRKPRDRQAVRRAGHIVEADLVTELDRRRVAAVLAADAELQLGLDAAALRDGDLHQAAHPLAVA